METRPMPVSVVINDNHTPPRTIKPHDVLRRRLCFNLKFYDPTLIIAIARVLTKLTGTFMRVQYKWNFLTLEIS